MFIVYEWSTVQDPPTFGTKLLVSGDPDKLLVKGEVLRVSPGENGGWPSLSIYIPDGQDGAGPFQDWIVNGGSVGIKLDEEQSDERALEAGGR